MTASSIIVLSNLAEAPDLGTRPPPCRLVQRTLVCRVSTCPRPLTPGVRAPLLGTHIASMLGKEPMMAIQIFHAILPLAIERHLEFLDNPPARSLGSLIVSVHIVDEHRQRLRIIAQLRGVLLPGRAVRSMM